MPRCCCCCHWKSNFGAVIPLLADSFRVLCVSYDGFDETEQTEFPTMLEETKTPRRPAFEPDGGVLLIESNGAGKRAYWSSFTKLRTASAMASAVRP